MMPRMLPAKMLYPDELQQYYLQDMPRIPMETLLTMYRTYMMNYRLKPGIRRNKAQVMYWYGEKEMKCVRRSAELFRSIHPNCRIYEAKRVRPWLSVRLSAGGVACARRPVFGAGDGTKMNFQQILRPIS